MGVISPETLTDGTVILVRGKRGKYSCQGVQTTQAGRTVVNLVGPIGTAHRAFHACYLEDVKGIC